MLWKKNKTEEKLSKIDESLKKSFFNVKKDTHTIFQWLDYFYKKTQEQERIIHKLRMEITYIPRTKGDIKKIIDGYYSFEGMSSKISQLDAKIDDLVRAQSEQRAQMAQAAQIARARITEKPAINPMNEPAIMHEIPTAIEGIMQKVERRLERLEQKKLSIKEKIIKKITRNSKEYVKSVIFSYIKKYEKVSALQLKEIVVDEQNFCSKSSFYRLLEEIEESDDIIFIKHGKEKEYILKAGRH